MGKRSDMPKIDKDFYPTTDPKAIPEKFMRLVRGKTFAEPCCGAGDLTDLLMDVATCKWESDIEYRGAGKVKDAMSLTKEDLRQCDVIITNPPFTKSVLLPMIDHFMSLKPTWLLLPADMMHNVYFKEYVDKCTQIVSVGRLKWFKDSPYSSTDNYAWYFWPLYGERGYQTVFHGRS